VYVTEKPFEVAGFPAEWNFNALGHHVRHFLAGNSASSLNVGEAAALNSLSMRGWRRNAKPCAGPARKARLSWEGMNSGCSAQLKPALD
jgi:hypothetical protein